MFRLANEAKDPPSDVLSWVFLLVLFIVHKFEKSLGGISLIFSWKENWNHWRQVNTRHHTGKWHKFSNTPSCIDCTKGGLPLPTKFVLGPKKNNLEPPESCVCCRVWLPSHLFAKRSDQPHTRSAGTHRCPGCCVAQAVFQGHQLFPLANPPVLFAKGVSVWQHQDNWVSTAVFQGKTSSNFRFCSKTFHKNSSGDSYFFPLKNLTLHFCTRTANLIRQVFSLATCVGLHRNRNQPYGIRHLGSLTLTKALVDLPKVLVGRLSWKVASQHKRSWGTPSWKYSKSSMTFMWCYFKMVMCNLLWWQKKLWKHWKWSVFHSSNWFWSLTVGVQKILGSVAGCASIQPNPSNELDGFTNLKLGSSTPCESN